MRLVSVRSLSCAHHPGEPGHSRLERVGVPRGDPTGVVASKEDAGARGERGPRPGSRGIWKRGDAFASLRLAVSAVEPQLDLRAVARHRGGGVGEHSNRGVRPDARIFRRRRARRRVASEPRHVAIPLLLLVVDGREGSRRSRVSLPREIGVVRVERGVVFRVAVASLVLAPVLLRRVRVNLARYPRVRRDRRRARRRPSSSRAEFLRRRRRERGRRRGARDDPRRADATFAKIRRGGGRFPKHPRVRRASYRRRTHHPGEPRARRREPREASRIAQRRDVLPTVPREQRERVPIPKPPVRDASGERVAGRPRSESSGASPETHLTKVIHDRHHGGSSLVIRPQSLFLHGVSIVASIEVVVDARPSRDDARDEMVGRLGSGGGAPREARAES